VVRSLVGSIVLLPRAVCWLGLVGRSGGLGLGCLVFFERFGKRGVSWVEDGFLGWVGCSGYLCLFGLRGMAGSFCWVCD
jgi:hypothetical protein